MKEEKNRKEKREREREGGRKEGGRKEGGRAGKKGHLSSATLQSCWDNKRRQYILNVKKCYINVKKKKSGFYSADFR